MPQTLINPSTKHTVQVDTGFSWYAFLLTPIYFFTKGLPMYAIGAIIIAVASFGFGVILWIIAGFKGNEWVKDNYLKQGYELQEATV
jgi:hypothetical protein